MNDTDDELLARIATGDRAAFTAFYVRHASTVFNGLRKWLPSVGEAEEALQEVFWQVWRQADRFDPNKSPAGGWLAMLARSRALDLIRRRQRVVLANLPGDARERFGDEVESDEALAALEHVELSDRLTSAFETLPEEQRSALQLAFYAGLTYEQVAIRQSIPLGTAKTRIRLALRRLRIQLVEFEK